MADSAGTTRIGYEVPNALGSLYQVAPRLATKCMTMTNYALAVQTYLRAVDFYSFQTGVPARKVRVQTTISDGRIVQRITNV